MTTSLCYAETGTAHVTMIVVLFGAYSANATAITMKSLLLIPFIIPHSANEAAVLAHFNSTSFTILLWLLLFLAFETPD